MDKEQRSMLIRPGRMALLHLYHQPTHCRNGLKRTEITYSQKIIRVEVLVVVLNQVKS